MKPRWSLSPEAFEALLAALHQDRTQAGVRYEQLRLKLVKFFTWERVSFPEERADEAFNRLARRLAEGESITSPEAYLSGVARLLLREAFDQQRRERTFSTELTLAHSRNRLEPDEDETVNCLTRCIGQVTPNNRDLILRYYHGERQTRIRNRQRMAEQYGIPLNALRNRALRVRGKLEECIRRCLGKNPGEMFPRSKSQKE